VNYPFLTQKERDIETALDFFVARYYAGTQGRFTSIDPVLVTADRLADPQQMNLYSYVKNNPLLYVDPTGEEIVLTGGEDDHQRGTNRLRNMLGEERFNLLAFSKQNIEGSGNVTVAHFASEENRRKFEAIGGDDLNERQFSRTMSDVIADKAHVEFRVATRFAYKGLKIFGYQEIVHVNVAEYGGAATVTPQESLTGNIQIFVAPNANDIAFWTVFNAHQKGISKSNDGKQLSFTNEQVDAHEFGHAWTMVKLFREPRNIDTSGRALRMENIVRIRQKSSNIRIAH
jgi:RHS repeat-associated protein